jgi:hypothetical protein
VIARKWQRIGILDQELKIKTAHSTEPDVENIVLIFMFLLLHTNISFDFSSEYLLHNS